MKSKILFIDRDGTLIVEPADKQIDSLEKLAFMPYVFSELARIASTGNYDLVMVSNQDGLGTTSFPEENFWPAQNKLLQALKNEGIEFKAIHIDPSFESDNSPNRKPRTGMLTAYFNDSIDLAGSFVIGDRITDIQLAKNLGCKAILISEESQGLVVPEELSETVVHRTNDWRGIATHLTRRSATVKRTTKETDIHITINLDGSGQSKVSTGLGFFDHMLDQLARHSGIDLSLTTKGDLHIDEHHTIEDTAIALGEAFQQALGQKRGLARYGFCLPMDDCLAQVAIDFGGRPWLVWEAEFNREKIGEMPTELFMHFFKSFSDSAKCNLNVKAEGYIEHHKIEAIFKAFARALKMAIKVEGNELPTTKGIL
jgi:imidazoleglycerol-phosphate dehydratase/histidinol-phosphatase